MVEISHAVLLDDSDDDASVRLAEREHRLAVALTGLELGEFNEADVARLLALVSKMPARFQPLAAMIEHSLGMASADG